MTDSRQYQLLEIYKLHSELAERVSQRRDGTNRLHVSLLVGLSVFLVGFSYGGEVMEKHFLGTLGAIGALLSGSWYIVLRSCRQLNSAKFKALHELEKKLAYPFFTREREFLGEGENINRDWSLTVFETALPFLYFVLFLGITSYLLVLY